MYPVTLIPGDGIGPSIMEAAVNRVKQVVKMVERVDRTVDEISFERNPDGTGGAGHRR